MAIKILKAMIPVVLKLAKDLSDGQLSADEKEAIIVEFTTVIADLISEVVVHKK